MLQATVNSASYISKMPTSSPNRLRWIRATSPPVIRRPVSRPESAWAANVLEHYPTGRSRLPATTALCMNERARPVFTRDRGQRIRERAEKSYALYRECAGRIASGVGDEGRMPAHSRYNAYDLLPTTSDPDDLR